MTEPLREKKVLLDSDVIRHFIKGDRLLDLPRLFPDRLVVLQNVKDELCRSKNLVVMVTNFIAFNKIEVMSFPSENNNVLKAYAELLAEGRGDGESSIMAVARYYEQIVASSNLRDIKDYCSLYKIEYLTTMDILLIGFEKGVITEEECDYFIYKVKSSGSKLPVNSINDYIKMKNNTTK